MRAGEASLQETSPHSLFGGLSPEAWGWLVIKGADECSFLSRYLPSFPEDPEFRRPGWMGIRPRRALKDGFKAYELFKELHEKYAGPLSPASRVLDFGCGWGRMIRFFLKDVEPQNLVGVDPYEPAIRACKETNRWCRFELCEVLPPTTLEPESFDLIYAFSVFSHLAEDAHHRWLEELERLLGPKGALILTTFNRAFLEDQGDCSGYDRGEFSFHELPALHRHYGNAFIPEEYVRKHWTKRFVVHDFFEAPEWGQNIIVCTKP